MDISDCEMHGAAVSQQLSWLFLRFYVLFFVDDTVIPHAVTVQCYTPVTCECM